MEGTLKPDYHYILIKNDFSDLKEKLSYYSHHKDEAKLILKNAHDFISQFKNEEREKIISLKVLHKYFEITGQL